MKTGSSDEVLATDMVRPGLAWGTVRKDTVMQLQGQPRPPRLPLQAQAGLSLHPEPLGTQKFLLLSQYLLLSFSFTTSIHTPYKADTPIHSSSPACRCLAFSLERKVTAQGCGCPPHSCHLSGWLH